MTQYLISFGDDAMDHIAEEDMPAVAKAARAVCQDAIDAGVFVLAGGLEAPASSVAAGGTVTGGPKLGSIGGVMVIDVSSRPEALNWAARVAEPCRCAQQVQEIIFDPELNAILRENERRRFSVASGSTGSSHRAA